MELKQKISQMFITGFHGKEPSNNFEILVKTGLGGVIFFTHNIENENQFKTLISNISKKALVPLFFSIDQEGGRVERTENIHNGKKYLSSKFAFEKGHIFLQNQTKEIAQELKNYGINMNFAPVVDVNTNKNNPIIGERAFSNKTEDVIQAEKIVLKEYKENGIITVAKHFPGHGDASVDSHQALPVIDLPYDELKNIHIKPFIEAIKENVPAIMVAHVLYPVLDDVPASISEKIINGILIKELEFNGVILTDDMEMNGIKGFSKLDACIKAINAGINMFIFRDTTNEIIQLIDNIYKAVQNGLISEDRINISFKKIMDLKLAYNIIQSTNL